MNVATSAPNGNGEPATGWRPAASRFGTGESCNTAGTTRSSKRYTDRRTGQLAERTLGFGAPRRRKNAFITVLLRKACESRRTKINSSRGDDQDSMGVRNQGGIRAPCLRSAAEPLTAGTA